MDLPLNSRLGEGGRGAGETVKNLVETRGVERMLLLVNMWLRERSDILNIKNYGYSNFFSAGWPSPSRHRVGPGVD